MKKWILIGFKTRRLLAVEEMEEKMVEGEGEIRTVMDCLMTKKRILERIQIVRTQMAIHFLMETRLLKEPTL